MLTSRFLRDDRLTGIRKLARLVLVFRALLCAFARRALEKLVCGQNSLVSGEIPPVRADHCGVLVVGGEREFGLRGSAAHGILGARERCGRRRGRGRLASLVFALTFARQRAGVVVGALVRHRLRHGSREGLFGLRRAEQLGGRQQEFGAEGGGAACAREIHRTVDRRTRRVRGAAARTRAFGLRLRLRLNAGREALFGAQAGSHAKARVGTGREALAPGGHARQRTRQRSALGTSRLVRELNVDMESGHRDRRGALRLVLQMKAAAEGLLLRSLLLPLRQRASRRRRRRKTAPHSVRDELVLDSSERRVQWHE